MNFWQTVGHQVFYNFSVNNPPEKILNDAQGHKEKITLQIKEYLKELAISFGETTSILQEIGDMKIIHMQIEEHTFLVFDIPPNPMEHGDFVCATILITIDQTGRLVSRYFMMIYGIDESTESDYILYAEYVIQNNEKTFIVHSKSPYPFFGLFIDKILELLDENIRLVEQF